MTSYSTIDMAEVNRLTREGRLDDAMTLLAGGSIHRPRTDDGRNEHGRHGKARETLDLKRRGQGWSMPDGSHPEAGETTGPEAPKSARTARQPKATLFSAPFRETLKRTVSPSIRRHDDLEIAVPDGASFTEETFRCSAGTRPFKLYVPSGYQTSSETVPLVVMLHGCTQSPDDFAIGTRMNELAEEKGFLVLYPSQTRSANASKCWNWFSVSDQQRDSGEPAIIAGMVRSVRAEYRIDRKRIFAAGLSAGGAAAAILGQRYPDLFTATGVHSGLACGSAKDVSSAFSAMKGQGTATGAGEAIPTIIFQGTSDRTVAPVNADRVAAQALGGQETIERRENGRSDGGIAFTRTVHTSKRNGRPVLESWALNGMSHAWSGGCANGSYTDPNGPDASREMIRFFEDVASGQPN